MNRKGFGAESIVYIGMAIVMLGLGIYIKTLLPDFNTVFTDLLQFGFVIFALYGLAKAVDL
jgi:hypothetical protein